jgi:putative ABC transport system ATP-binding protein
MPSAPPVRPDEAAAQTTVADGVPAPEPAGEEVVTSGESAPALRPAVEGAPAAPAAPVTYGVVPGAALAFLNAEQRAAVREQAPLVLPDAPLPPAAAAMAALARKGKGPVIPPRPPAPLEQAAQPVTPALDGDPEVTSAVDDASAQAPVEEVAVAAPAADESLASPESAVEAPAIVAAAAVPVAAAAVQQKSPPVVQIAPGPHTGQNPVISVRNITKVYTMGDVEVHALRGVDLDIFPGEMTAIMGPSGSGKSTLMNIIGCLDVPSDGVYLLDGEDVSRMSDDQLADVRSRKIGFVFQSFNLLSRTSALANVELPLLYSGQGSRNRHKRAQQVLDLVGLGQRMHHKPNELSGGQQQRVAIARALINEPAMILADEPTGNLDSKTSVEIMELFQRLNRERGITIIFVTHNIETADYCHRVVHVRDGHVERDVRHQPRAGIYRDLLPEDLPVEALRIPAQDVAPVTADVQTLTPAPSGQPASEVPA